MDLRQWTEELMKYAGALELLQEFQNWQLPKFPVSGNVLIEKKVPGKHIQVNKIRCTNGQ